MCKSKRKCLGKYDGTDDGIGSCGVQMDSEKCLIKKFSDFDSSWRLRYSPIRMYHRTQNHCSRLHIPLHDSTSSKHNETEEEFVENVLQAMTDSGSGNRQRLMTDNDKRVTLQQF